MRLLRWILLGLLFSSPVFAQLMMTGIGPGGGHFVALTPCGTGVIDLSAGCLLPQQLGLVP